MLYLIYLFNFLVNNFVKDYAKGYYRAVSMLEHHRKTICNYSGKTPLMFFKSDVQLY